MSGYRFRLLCLAGLLSVMLGARLAPAAAADAYDPWPGLVQDIFNNRPMNDGDRRDRHRDAVPRRGCGDRAGDPAHQAARQATAAACCGSRW